jgi:hypothetical protein
VEGINIQIIHQLYSFFSAPRTICYTQSATERTFDYQIPKKNVNVELKGNTVKKVAPPETKEETM